MGAMVTSERAEVIREFGGESLADEGFQQARALLLEELPGIAFGLITLLWIFTSVSSLIW
jgi:hypothetical protein